MGRKKVFLLFISIVLMSLFANLVSAQDEGSEGLSGVAETIERLFGFIPNVITLEKLIGEDGAAMFWARFLIWLLLFAAYFFGASRVFKDSKNIAIVVALVLSLISALLIPSAIIINIFQSYGFVAGVLVWLIPVIAGFYLISKIKQKFLRAIVYLLILVVLLAIDKSITSSFGEGLVDDIWYSLFRLLIGVIIISFIWNLLTGWMHNGEQGSNGRDTGSNVWDRLTGRREPNVRDPNVRQPNVREPERDRDGHVRRDDEIRINQDELYNLRQLWERLKELRNNQHLGRLITNPKDGAVIDDLVHITQNIVFRTRRISGDINKEINENNDNDRRERLRSHLGVTDHNRQTELLDLIRRERNMFNGYRDQIRELARLVAAGTRGIENNMENGELSAIWQNASERALTAMRHVEMLIRLNVSEINTIGEFNE